MAVINLAYIEEPGKLNALNERLQISFGFKLLYDKKFWKEEQYIAFSNLKTELILFTTYLLAFYDFEQWNDYRLNFEDEEVKKELALAFKTVTGKTIKPENLTSALIQLKEGLHDVIKNQFRDLMDDVSDALSADGNVAYSQDGAREKGAQKNMTPYNKK